MALFNVRPVRRVARVLALSVTLGLPACASGSGGGGGGASANVITQRQIDDAGVDDTYQLIQRYKSRWLRPARNQNITSGTTAGSLTGGSDGDVVAGQELYARVFVDDHPYGEIDSLRSIDPRSIESIEFISSTDATTRYGTGYIGGIIQVHTRASR
jgi:TonB-dependent Receptor Plug Domain